MNLEEITRDIFEGLGEPSDLDFYLDPDARTIDYTGVNWARMVALVNQAQLTISTWKFPDGKQLRLRLNEGRTLVGSRVLSATVADVTGSDYTLTGAGFPVGDDALYGWLVVGPLGSGIVLNSDGNATNVVLQLYKSTGTISIGDTVTLAKREYLWVNSTRITPTTVLGIPANFTSGRPLELLDVVDSTTDTKLELALKYDSGLSVSTTPGIPATIFKIPQGFRFDVWPSEERIYEVRYMKGPRLFTIAVADGALEPEIPVQFHQAMVLYGLWWGYRRGQESGDAYSAKRDLDDTLRRIRTEFDLQDELTKGQIKFYPEGR